MLLLSFTGNRALLLALSFCSASAQPQLVKEWPEFLSFKSEDMKSHARGRCSPAACAGAQGCLAIGPILKVSSPISSPSNLAYLKILRTA